MQQLSLLDLQPEPVQKVAATAKPIPTTANQVLQVWRCTNGTWHYTGQMGFEHALTLRPGDIALPVGDAPATVQPAPAAPPTALSRHHQVLFKMHLRVMLQSVPTRLLGFPLLLFWLMAIAAEELANCHNCQWFLASLNQSKSNGKNTF